MTQNDALFAAIDATWPAAEKRDVPGFTLRRGADGGNRVSAATARDGWDDCDIPAAEAGMTAFGQTPLFMIRPWDAALDAALAARGYASRDATRLLQAPAEMLAAQDKRHPVVMCAPRLAIMTEIWATGGIGTGRMAVMDRASLPKTHLLGRIEDTPCAVAFVSIADDIAMLHALEVLPEARGQGLGRAMTCSAAAWAMDAGASRFAVLVTERNAPANALYAALGLTAAGGYHYRTAPEQRPDP